MSLAITDTAQEKRVISLLKRKIIPFAFLLYFFNVMDRVNIGFAALTMNTELNISNAQFGTITSLFFLAYLLFLVPSNIILSKAGPRRWIGFLFTAWGMVTASTFFADGITFITITRFLIGVFEAGFFPGMIFYIASWFPEKERGYASGMFMLAGAVAQLLASPVSGWIVQHVHILGYQGWRWLFLLEGVPTVILGIFIFFLLTDSPKEAKWLNESDRNWLINKLEQEKAAKPHYDKVNLRSIICNVQLWQLAFAYMFVQAAIQAAGFWLPKQFKVFDGTLSDTQIGFIVAAPFLMAILFSNLWAKHSDRTGERKWHAAAAMLVCAISFVSVSLVEYMPLRIVLLSLYGLGMYAYYGPFWAMPSTLLSPAILAIAIAIINSCSGLGGMFANMAIGHIEQHYGPTWSLLFQALLCCISVLIIASIKFPKKTSIQVSESELKEGTQVI